jgi:hypothetical protein
MNRFAGEGRKYNKLLLYKYFDGLLYYTLAMFTIVLVIEHDEGGYHEWL